MQPARYFHTIRFLKFEQIYFQIYYKLSAKLCSVLRLKSNYDCYKKGTPVELGELPCKPATYCGENVFSFLNISHKFNGVWDERANGDLWRYNLNYMDFLLQPSLSVEEKCAWIESFIDSANGNRIANDPYPISLRGINWIKFVSSHKKELSGEFLKKTDTFLYSQYLMLYKRPERHLLANHYLENAFSLLFAAVYFGDEKIWKKAESILEKQLPEQILSDGAHFELSPMYHCVILERVLDCYNLLCNNRVGNLFTGADALCNLILKKAQAMLSWLDAIVVADDRIPLLNDSAENVALSPSALRSYARSLKIEWGEGRLGESGYRRIVKENYATILDVAPLGVSYNLGHSHADTGTFLVWCKERPLLVDTGTSTYNAGERRDYERSTRAHNTVVVNGRNSSDVWGAFRCAKRATVNLLNDGPDCFEMQHNGYGDFSCYRKFLFNNDALCVVDTIKDGNSEAVAYFHLAPDVKILNVGADKVVTDVAVFSFKGAHSVNVENVEVAKEYNSLHPSLCICVAFKDTLETIIGDFKLKEIL